MAKKKSSLMFTYIGVIRKADDVETIILDEIMRKFQSGKRYLRERIFEGKSRKEAVDMAKPLFINNSRYMRDAFLEAEASISSQKELLPTYIQQNQLKVAALNEQITKLTNSKKKNKEGKIKYKHSK
ncbi:hypothetical protein [Metabacillus rhizolycopersici]|uniref:Transposase n=1 Tax=Metabacillus rhizolycopersici TaxID=2875709 RepID=A0ABS7UY09_9BACI|nr:hypothetical protein [Metabacillus rhizolycopersici]MBZ5752883.1 hypothetical protein [Metabacillus rhizolycopersici]